MNRSEMVDPHKIGTVMWALTEDRYMVPIELHDKITVSDKDSLDRVYSQLMAFRKVEPALQVIAKRDWVSMAIIKPYLINSIGTRTGARALKVDGSWDEFWSAVN